MTTPIEILTWDSRFFGRRMARVRGAILSRHKAEAAIAACQSKDVKCLTYLASAQDARSIASAEEAGFRLMDIRITLARDVAEPILGMTVPLTVTYRPARKTDTRALQTLAGTLFTDSRFAVDPHFPRDASKKLFSTWIAKSVAGRFDDWVGVAEERGRLAGFISCRRMKSQTGLIGLIGVATRFRRRGIGRLLISQGLDWFRAAGIKHINVITQGRAVGAQQLYQACGFRTSQVDLWYHKWF